MHTDQSGPDLVLCNGNGCVEREFLQKKKYLFDLFYAKFLWVQIVLSTISWEKSYKQPLTDLHLTVSGNSLVPERCMTISVVGA